MPFFHGICMVFHYIERCEKVGPCLQCHSRNCHFVRKHLHQSILSEYQKLEQPCNAHLKKTRILEINQIQNKYILINCLFVFVTHICS